MPRDLPMPAVWAFPMFDRSRNASRSEFQLVAFSPTTDITYREIQPEALSSNLFFAQVVFESRALNKPSGFPLLGRPPLGPHRSSSKLQPLSATNKIFSNNYLKSLSYRSVNSWGQPVLYAIAVGSQGGTQARAVTPITENGRKCGVPALGVDAERGGSWQSSEQLSRNFQTDGFEDVELRV
jgi:hypothetical protein